MPLHTRYDQISAYITKDGSEIRELMHPAVQGNREQSLAEARIPAGTSTLLHRHGRSEEIYHVTAGRGIMTLGDERFGIGPGDTLCIPPGVPHRVENVASESLVILCCSSPPYAHEDTELLAEAGL